MALPTPAYVRAISLTPLFDDVADALIGVALDEAALHYVKLGAQPEYANIVALHALHLLWLTPGAVKPGPVKPVGVSGASAGGVSVSYAVPAPAPVNPTGYVDATTPWGARCLGLLESLPPRLRAGGAAPW